MASDRKVRFGIKKPIVWIGLVLVIGAGLIWAWSARPKPETSSIFFTARRGPLDITVVQGGSVQALESQESRSEIKGYQGTKILKIVEEGYSVTEEDVKMGKVLVELDSSEIRNKITQQDIQFESTAASLIDAQQAYDIQVNQNLSDVKAAEQKAKFSRMDFEKFMGGKAAAEIIGQLGLGHEDTIADTNHVPTTASTSPATTPQDRLDRGTTLLAGLSNAAPILVAELRQETETRSDANLSVPPPALPSTNSAAPPAVGQVSAVTPAWSPVTNTAPRSVLIDFAKYAEGDLLGDGEAEQKIRKLDDDLQVAEKERLLNQSTFEGTKRLFEKEFATRTELDNDELKLQNSKLKVQTAQTARSLFLKI